MRFRGHETFHIRKGWLNKGIRNVMTASDVFISKEENPMDVLGIGANMVKALRYWLQAVGITEEPSRGKRSQTFTRFGELIYGHDQYIEEISFINRIEDTNEIHAGQYICIPYYKFGFLRLEIPRASISMIQYIQN